MTVINAQQPWAFTPAHIAAPRYSARKRRDVHEHRRAAIASDGSRFYEKAFLIRAVIKPNFFAGHLCDGTEPHARGVSLASIVINEPPHNEAFVSRTNAMPGYNLAREDILRSNESKSM